MVLKWVISYLIGFVMRQLATFQHSIDWTKVKTDLDVRLRAMIPGQILDNEAVLILNTALDEIAKMLASTDKLQAILNLLAAEKWVEAGQELLTMLMEAVQDATTPQHIALKEVLAKVQLA